MKEQNRYVGLDLLRAIILIFGPTFHASMLMNGSFGFEGYVFQSKLIESILNYTHPFRMDLFFIISGFFASLLLTRKNKDYYINSRINKIIKPTLFSIITIVPITFFIIYFIQGFKDLSYTISYRHVWFLVTLSLISLFTFLKPEILLKIVKAISNEINKFSLLVIAIIFCLISIFFHVAAYSIAFFINDNFNEITQITNSIRYFGLFLIGMIIFFMQKKFSNKYQLGFFLIFTTWYFIKCLGYLDFLGKFNIIISDALSITMCLSVFYYFLNLNLKSNKIIIKISKISLPFYLIHLPFLILISSIWLNVFGYATDIIFIFLIIPLNILGTYYLSLLSLKSKLIKKSLGIK